MHQKVIANNNTKCYVSHPCAAPASPLCHWASLQRSRALPQHQRWGFQGRMNGLSQATETQVSDKEPQHRGDSCKLNLQLLSLATEDTSSPHLAAGRACVVCGLSFLGGNSAGQPITHTPVLTADIPVLTPRAALSYFRESHFHIPPSNSPPRSDQSLSAFTLQ